MAYEYEIADIIITLISGLILFLILFTLGKIISKRIKKHESKFTNNRLFNPREYFPDEEIETLKQVYYLVMQFLIFILILYDLVFRGQSGTFALLEILLMLHIAITLNYKSWKNKLLFFLIIPYSSFMIVLFELIGFFLKFKFSILDYPDMLNAITLLNIIHVPVLLYLLVDTYKKFREYTENNGLGITIVLLFIIIFLSFNFTIIAEGQNPIDSIVMVSNAFTSNGYAILGSTTAGKLNSLLLVWSGYIISGVGTATLAAAILSKQFNSKIENMEEDFKKQNEELKEIKAQNKEIKELLKKNKQ